MAYISTEEIKNILNQRPPDLTPEGIVETLVERGHKIEGLNATTAEVKDYKSGQTYNALFPNVTGGSPVGNVLRSVANVPSSFINLIKNLGTGAFNVFNPNPEKNTLSNLGETLGETAAAGIAKLGLAPKGSNAEQGNLPRFKALARGLQERYGGLENLQRTAVNDPFGFGSEIFSVLDAGAHLAGQGAVFDKLVSDVAQKGVIQPLKSITSFTGRQGAKILGFTTGAGQEPVERAFSQGATPEFTEGLRGKNPENILDKAENALTNVVNDRAAKYQSQLAEIKTQTKSLDISPLVDKEHQLLDRFNIKEIGHDLTEDSFRQSAIANDPAAMRDIINIHDRIHDLGSVAGDRTPLALDALKRQLGDLYSKTSNSRAFVTSIKNEVKNLLNNNVEGYSQMTADYERTSDLMNDIKKTLAVGTPKAHETVLNKLTQAIRTDKGLKRAMLNELTNVGGDEFMNQLAGNALRSPIPGGLFRKGAGFAAGTKAVFSAFANPGGLFTILAPVAATSPRLVGEFLRALGIASNKISSILNYLGSSLPAQATKVAVSSPIIQALKILNQTQQPIPK